MKHLGPVPNTLDTGKSAPRRTRLSITPKPGTDAFWFVWRVGARAPRMRHATCEGAIAEAERLSALIPGATFAVYMARRVASRCNVVPSTE